MVTAMHNIDKAPTQDLPTSVLPLPSWQGLMKGDQLCGERVEALAVFTHE